MSPVPAQTFASHAARFSTVVGLILAVSLTTGCSKTAAPVASGGTSTISTAAATPSPSDSSGSGQCPTSNTTPFAKTKFVLHSGLAFGAFHRYIYKPFRAGTFASGQPGRLTGFIKAGLAAAFVEHEVRLALEDAKANPTLCNAISAPLSAVGNTVSGALSSLKSGDSSGLDSVNSAISSAESSATKSGIPIQEPANPSLTGG